MINIITVYAVNLTVTLLYRPYLFKKIDHFQPMREQTVILRGVTSCDYYILSRLLETPRKITVCPRIGLKWSIIDMVF